MKAEQKKTGTTTVGLVFNGGVVMASEKKATLGYLVDSVRTRKVFPIADNIALTTAGSVGDVQTIVRYMRAEINIFKFQKGKPMSVKGAASLLSNILQGNRFYPYMGQFLLGGHDEKGPRVFSLDPMGGVIGEDPFYSTGSGSPMAFAVLEDQYKEGMDKTSAIRLAIKSIRSARRRDIGSGGLPGAKGYTVVVIDGTGLKELTEEEIDEHLKGIETAK